MIEILESQTTHELSVILASPDERERYYEAFHFMKPIVVPELDGKTFIVQEMSGCYWPNAPEWMFTLLLRQYDTTRYREI